MKKIVNSRYQEQFVCETLDNGLHVVLWNKEDYAKSLFMMATPLGAFDLRQYDEAGNEYDFHAGIAHFLEHKMFDMEGVDVMDAFSSMGANCNAFTSYEETAYYFSTTNDIKEPLQLLLDFVQDFNISEESVEKEKGIIIQELNMYKQMSDNRLLMESFASLYNNHPLKYDIGGDEQSVKAITLDELKRCYRLNYHPSRMILIGIGSFDPNEVMAIIKENQAKKEFAPVAHVKRYLEHEAQNIARKSFSFSMDVSEQKTSIIYKLDGFKDVILRNKMEWSIKLLCDAYFSSLNPQFQRWMDEGIVNDYVGCESDFSDSFGLLMFFGESNPEKFEKIVTETMYRMQNELIDEELMQRLKRRYYGIAIRNLNSFDEIAISYVRAYFAGIDLFESLQIIDNLTIDDLKQAQAYLKDKEFAKIVLMPEK